MCLKVIENGKHKDVHIKEGEVSYQFFFHMVVYSAQYLRIAVGLQITVQHFL